MPSPSEKRLIRVGHSPDPDDAFMIYGFASGGVDCGDLVLEHVLADIQTLNEWALEGRLEVTAVSMGAYAHIAERYALLPNGASIGDGYGPIVVARTPELALVGKRIAVPGVNTTAYLVLRLLLEQFEAVPMPFDQIIDAVTAGEVDAGLVIHEGQLTYADAGLHKLVDIGAWWMEREGLPLPLGVDCVRRDLGPELCSRIAGLLGASIAHGMAHRDEAIEFARQYGRGIDPARTHRFVEMYVNHDTLDYGERGREAVRRVLRRGHERGYLPAVASVDFISFPESGKMGARGER
ncbi:MAG: ABC transporter substrate-binding protein [Proteobacteria bacterium]|nr:ABC transporter substrate-binding protein [Pseudomonadota bacterium]